MSSLLFFLSFSFPWTLCQELSLFPPDTWNHHLHNPYHTYYHGSDHNGGQVVDHGDDQVRASHGHFHTCNGWTCHSDWQRSSDNNGYQMNYQNNQYSGDSANQIQNQNQNPQNQPVSNMNFENSRNS